MWFSVAICKKQKSIFKSHKVFFASVVKTQVVGGDNHKKMALEIFCFDF
jgi:hypothetical protein